MESMINVSPKVDKESAASLAQLIERIFNSAAKNRMEQETVKVALIQVFSKLSVNGLTITDCHLEGPKVINN